MMSIIRKSTNAALPDRAEGNGIAMLPVTASSTLHDQPRKLSNIGGRIKTALDENSTMIQLLAVFVVGAIVGGLSEDSSLVAKIAGAILAMISLLVIIRLSRKN